MIENNILTECIRADSEYGQLLETMERTRKKPLPIIAAGLCDGATDALLVTLLSDIKNRKWGETLIVCAEEKECQNIVSLVERFGIRAAFFPTRDLTLHNITASHEFEYGRLSVLSGIIEGAYDVIVTTPDATLGYTIPPDVLADSSVCVNENDNVEIGALCAKLTKAGFERVDMTESVGQFAVRGGIIDVFPTYAVYGDSKSEKSGQLPVRIELFGDEIDRMGIFDPDSQRFTESIKSVRITPVREVVPDDEKLSDIKRAISLQIKKTNDKKAIEEMQSELASLEGTSDAGFLDKYISLIYPEKASLLDYFGSDRTILIKGTQAVRDRLKSYFWLNDRTVTELCETLTINPKYADYTKPESAFDTFTNSSLTVHIDSISSGFGSKKLGGIFGFRTKHTVSYAGNFGLLCDDIESYIRGGYRVLIAVENDTAAQNTKELLEDRGYRVFLGVNEGEFSFDNLPAKSILIRSNLGIRGYELVVPKIAVLVTTPQGREASAGATKIKKRSRRRSGTAAIMSFNELNIGDYVVHESYGIGLYQGLENMLVGGVRKDYLKIKYAGSDVLYLPVERMDLVSRYIGSSDDGNIKLSHFGGTEWKKAKSRARAAVAEIAKELVKLYAERMKLPGYAFPEDDDFQRDFENAFEYDETEAQLSAADEIKHDMMRSVPMDRLLCGDVGYGKTEVAFRAAFKAVLGGKQVAILVPTTILALQHYQTAVSRMRGFPVTVDMVSRFRSPKQQASTLRAVGRGETDIIIGTHRLLSKDVEFKDLGLLIVDEEQRFGVAQKEKIKQMSGNIDVLSLSATPIPRTLNMAMGGIRDISVLDEAPGDRLPIQTYVLEHDNTIIFEAIRRELRRGGQVFYLHNIVEDIDTVARKIREAIPDANIVTAHGKMDKEQLEDIWARMLSGEIDILVCTTIIETGVDVPNANTLIVDNAHRLGLSQLHQIRGRVGRSARRAYAYFTYPAGMAISEISEKRLEAIREYTEFGSGFRIALRDLELRGAGNLLGTQQHGHLDAVGYDLYIKMLNEAVLEEKGEKVHEEPDCKLTINISAFIPASYVESAAQRMALYKRIALIRNELDMSDITDELIDRYGDIPANVKNLLRIALVRAKAMKCNIKEIAADGNMINIYSDDFDMEVWLKLGDSYKGLLKLVSSPAEHIAVRMPTGSEACGYIEAMLDKYIAIKYNTDNENDV